MPIYEYQCENCCAEFELLRRITDESTPVCEKCGSEDVHRLVSQSSFILKGSGWYVTDYGKSDGRKEAHTEDAASNGADSKAPKFEKKESGSEPSPSSSEPKSKESKSKESKSAAHG